MSETIIGQGLSFMIILPWFQFTIYNFSFIISLCIWWFLIAWWRWYNLSIRRYLVACLGDWKSKSRFKFFWFKSICGFLYIRHFIVWLTGYLVDVLFVFGLHSVLDANWSIKLKRKCLRGNKGTDEIWWLNTEKSFLKINLLIQYLYIER